MDKQEVRLITKSNTSATQSNEVIISKTLKQDTKIIANMDKNPPANVQKNIIARVVNVNASADALESDVRRNIPLKKLPVKSGAQPFVRVHIKTSNQSNDETKLAPVVLVPKTVNESPNRPGQITTVIASQSDSSKAALSAVGYRKLLNKFSNISKPLAMNTNQTETAKITTAAQISSNIAKIISGTSILTTPNIKNSSQNISKASDQVPITSAESTSTAPKLSYPTASLGPGLQIRIVTKPQTLLADKATSVPTSKSFQATESKSPTTHYVIKKDTIDKHKELSSMILKGNIVPVRKDNLHIIQKIDNGTDSVGIKILKRIQLDTSKSEQKRIKLQESKKKETIKTQDAMDKVVPLEVDDKTSKNIEKESAQLTIDSAPKIHQGEVKGENATKLLAKMKPIKSDAEHNERLTMSSNKSSAHLHGNTTTLAEPSSPTTTAVLLASTKNTAAAAKTKNLSARDIQQKLLKIFTERNMQKIDYRSRTLGRIKNSPRRGAGHTTEQKVIRRKKLRQKLNFLTNRNPVKKNISMKQFEDDWNSLTKVLSTHKAVPSDTSLLSNSVGGREEFVKDQLKIKSETKPLEEVDAFDGQKSNGLALPFLTNLNQVITWNRQNRSGTLQNGILAFERNEFGMLELYSDENDRESKRSESAKNRRGRGYKRTEVPKLVCGHSEFDECFNAVIVKLRSEFWINQTTPADHYSKEFKDTVKLCIEKHDQKCYRVSKYDIQMAMSGSGLLKKTIYVTQFDWDAYLAKWKSKIGSTLYPAPHKFFFNPIPNYTNPFIIGHKLEAIDPLNCSKFCVCTVIEVCGFRIKLHFDGYHQIYDFWVNANSTEIFPVGWCDKTARKLYLPYRFGTNAKFRWTEYLKGTSSIAAPTSCFPHVQILNTERNPFKIGMKLEADCVKDSSKLCLASIGDVIDNRVLVTFDGIDHTLSYWTDINSPYLHPINWHQRNGCTLSLPQACNKQRFSWESYLARRGEAVPEKAFCTRNPIQFQSDMVLEVVDKWNSAIIRPARIILVKEYKIKVLFLEWPEEYAFYLDDDSPDIHPIGWTKVTEHPIVITEDASKFDSKKICVFAQCGGIGNAVLPEQYLHYKNEECPYHIKNLSAVQKIPNRFSPDYIKPTQILSLPTTVRRQVSEVSPLLRSEGVLKRNSSATILKPLQNPAELANMSPKDVELYRRLQVTTRHLLENSANISILHRNWLEKLQPLRPVQILVHKKNPLHWTIDEVAQFVSELPNCPTVGDAFIKHEIDGLAFLSLRQNDIEKRMGLSLGTSIKIFNRIVYLRQECNAKYIRYG